MAIDNHTARAAIDIPLTCKPEDIHYRVLLALPDARTIPIFALGVEAHRPALDTRVIASRETLAQLVGGNLFRALQSRYGDHLLIDVRRRVGRRTAIYSQWLTFPTLVQADAFVGDHSRFGLNGIEAKTKADLASSRDLLARQLANGRFDMSCYEPLIRMSRAMEYTEKAEALGKLEWGLGGLSRLKQSLLEAPDGVSVG